jgi:hypothetical protein
MDGSWSYFATALLGGVIGGVLGVLGTLVTSYFGPRKLEEWREQKQEDQHLGKRKELLLTMLEDTTFEIRSLAQLHRVTGMTPEDCRLLLIELGARGVTMEGGQEGWALIDRYGLDKVQ